MTARRFGIGMGAATALLTAGAVVLPRLASAAVQRAIAEALGPSARVQVRFSSGLPLLLGRLEHLRLAAADVRTPGVRLRRLSLTAARVTLDLPASIAAGRLVVTRAHNLAARLVVGERALNARLAAHGVRIRLDAGSAELSTSEVRARGGFVVDGGRVWFRPDRLWVGGVPLPPLVWQRWLRRLDVRRATVDVTDLPLPVRLTAVEVRPGELVLAAVGPEGQ